MSALPHTPGPWHIEGTRGPGFIISAGTNSYGDGPAAYVGVLAPMHAAPTRADALLACAAPEMLEVLTRIAEAPAWGAPDSWEVTPSEVRQLARAAIAKARGES